MNDAVRNPALAGLDPFVGEWTIEAFFPMAAPSGVVGRTEFEWMTGGQFLIQRWEVPHPDAPDGISIIGVHAGTAAEIPTPADPWSTAAMLAVFFQYVVDGRMDLSPLMTHRVTLEDAPELYRTLERNRTAHLGVLIDWAER